MKKSTKKKVLITGGILLAVVLLFPVPLYYKDGGTVEYRAILYSVTEWHAHWGEGPHGEEKVREGISIEILGMEVIDNTYFHLY